MQSEISSTITTTLYDLFGALHTQADSENNPEVTALVAYLLRTGCLTFRKI